VAASAPRAAAALNANRLTPEPHFPGLSALEQRDESSKPTPRAGAWILERELARGGFGIVYHAVHAETGQRAAVKVLHAEWSADQGAITRFEREAEVLSSIAHPHLCELYAHGRLDDGRPFLAMELLSGVTLEQHLSARGRLPIEEVLSILEPLAAALDAAHARGIVHRDLKPSNVFLAEERPKGSVVLLDFGVAKLRDGQRATLTGSRDTLGTLLYMAPEQFVAAQVDARADVYALGALAYAMLAGRRPFGESAGRMLRQIRVSARPAAPSACAPIDPALDEPILRALERDVAARTASAGELVAALRAAAGGKGARPTPGAAVTRTTLAVYAEVRSEHASVDDDAEALLDEMEAALPLVASELARAGLVAVTETSTTLLLVDAEPGDAARAALVIEAAARAYRRFTSGPGRSGNVALAIAVHAGDLVVSPAGTLLGGGLLDVTSWVPAAPAGVVASRAALAGVSGAREPVPGARGFWWVER
jgi:serine/threonine-protein kinase